MDNTDQPIEVSDSEDEVQQECILYTNYFKFKLIVGVDIGEINFLVAIYCPHLGVMVDFLFFKLREPGIKQPELTLKENLNRFCSKHRDLWEIAFHGFVEFQFHSKNSMLEKAFMEMCYPMPTRNVFIRSVRSAYKEYFPDSEQEKKHKRRECNKSNAIEFGRNRMTEECRKKLADMGLEEEHDVYDALLFAIYGHEKILNK